MITLISFEADSTIALSLLFPSIAFAYLLTKKHSMRDIISGLGLKTSSLRLRAVAIGIALFVSIFLLQVIFSVFQIVTHIPLPTNVSMALQGMPIYLLVFAAIIAPIDEEILFRGFLVPRIGIIPSALIFAAFHISYLSISEFIAAFIFGLLAGYAFKRTKSLYTTIIGHALVNIVTILVLML
jgi:membrane protease YdiL (CAAX protease family)